MKRSKIFLGITTGVLAVVAFTAAKTAKFNTKKHGYYAVGSALGHCSINANDGSWYTQANSGTFARQGGHTLFEYSVNACSKPLFTIPDGD